MPSFERAVTEDLARGARDLLPVSVSVAAFGLVWGVLAGQAGLSVLEVLAMSGLLFAGASQFVALDLWSATPALLPIGALVAAVAVVNLRFLLLTATLRPLFGTKPGPGAVLLMALVADENWALTIGAMRRGPTGWGYLLGGGLLMWVVWVATTLAGRLLGSGIADPASYGLDFAFTATFLALLLGMWKGRADLLPWTVAAVSAVAAANLLGGNWYIIVGGLAGSLAGALAEIRRAP
jgi:4-azaleucine resistance transporter AzlC